MAHHRWRSWRCSQQWRQLATRAGVVHFVAANTEPLDRIATPARHARPEKLIAQLRSQVAAIDRSVALYAVQTYDDIFAQTLGPRRYEMLLLSSFACLALLLAAIGIYGVISYSVSQRSQEMGLRMAFGATPEDLSKLVLHQALFLSTIGLLLGIALGLASHKLSTAALFGITFVDHSCICRSDRYDPSRLSLGSLFTSPPSSHPRSHDHPPCRITSLVSGLLPSRPSSTLNRRETTDSYFPHPDFWLASLSSGQVQARS